MKRHIIDDKDCVPFRTFKKSFKKCVGTGRFDLALREDYMNNLRIVQNEIGFEHIRGHGILGDQTGVYRKRIQVDAQNTVELEEAVFNFSRVLKVMESYRSVGIKPFIELGFMPEDMAAGQKYVFWWKGNVTNPKDIRLWLELVEKLIRTLIEHYGIDEVRKWPIEVWNEPNANFWQPDEEDKETAYYKLYEATARQVKKIDQGLSVGGPATNGQGMDWVPRFIQYCFTNQVPVDFISQHIYASQNKRNSGEFIYMDLKDPQEVLAQFDRIQRYVDDSQYPQLPIHITEWNTSYSCIELVHDTALNAAYIAKILTHADHLVESIAYWVFCDVFEEADIPRALFHGGFGLLTENGIRKPTFHTFAFANQLKEQIIHLNDYACITQDEQGQIAMLLFNPQLNEENKESVQLNIKLKIPFNEVNVITRSIDELKGNAYAAWRQLGSPRHPLPKEMNVIRQAQYPEVTIQCINVDADDRIELNVTLPPNGVKLIDIFPRRNQIHQYQGLQI